MKVSFYATLRAIVGQKTVEIDLPQGANVRQLIDAIVAQYPDLRYELLDNHGQPHHHIHFFINGRDASYLEQQYETVIQPDDVVTIFPPVGGG